ncbi:uncharacterized protein [Nicotiana tomentosiformis]|uniref:uncharacterized protein n=1 Tax=Nicotiana tomentosiformis TaxID=4098 RepID=UPI00388CE408
MRDPTAVPWNYSKTVVTYKGKEIIGEVNEMNQPRKYHNPEEQKMLKLSKDKRFLPKKPVSSEEAEDSNEHQKVLLKTLNEAYVPVETSVEQLERMAEQFFEVNSYYMKRVMLDGGSRVDICPLLMLQRMKIRTERIRPNNVCVRAFDGVKRDTIGEIDLILNIGPMDFEVTFQVLDMDTSYNFLLGRPWIHVAGAVPFTLHQMVKFEHENQEIVIHEEDEQSIYRDPSVPCLEAREGSEHIVYQAFEIVIVDQYKEVAPFPQPCLSNASVMVATEMIKHGYKPGKGLGVYLQGIIEPVTSIANEKFFGVGFRATEADRKWADERKKNGWVLPQPVPHLAKSFIDPKYVEEEEEESFTAEEIEDICEAMKRMILSWIVMLGEEDAEKTAFTMPWGTYYYRVMPFALKNAGATYMRAMTAIFHDMMHREIKVYVDYVIIKSRTQEGHVRDLRKFFEHLRSRRGIELDPTKIKSIRDLPPPRTKKEVMSLLGRLNYLRRFIAQLTTTCEPIFKLLKKDAAIKWTNECQEAFDKIKEYLSNSPVLVPPEPGRPLFLYLTVLENSFGCVLGKHDVTGKREKAIYYLSKKFTIYEAKYTLLERTCCALTWVAQKLRHYLLAYTTYLITRMDPLKYIVQKPMPMGRLAKWQILLTEFDIVYVTRTTMKAQALADGLAENPVDDEYQPLSTYFPDEKVNSIEVIPEDTNAWKMFFGGAVNAKGVGIGIILVSPIGQHYPATARLWFFCTNNTAEYEACIMGMNMAVDLDVEELLIMGDSDLIIRQAQGEWETRDIKLIPYRQHVEDLRKRFKSVEFRYIPRFHNELADALATLALMLPYPGNVHIDPLEIQIRKRHGYCNTIEIELDVKPWYHDIKRFMKIKKYPE